MTNPRSVAISFLRQEGIFSRLAFEKDCHVIGIGALGSWTVECLVRIGVPRIHIYDADRLVAQNVPSQAYDPSQAERCVNKVDALVERFESFSGTRIIPHYGEVTKDSVLALSGVVFVCVDSMLARREIFEYHIRYNPSVELMAEMRMGAQEGRGFIVNPCDPDHVAEWEKLSAYTAPEVDEPPCTNRAIITTVWNLVSGIVHEAIVKRQNNPTKAANVMSVGFKESSFAQFERW